MNTKRAKNIYIHLKNYLSCLTSSFSIKISKMNRKPNPKVLLYYCPCTQATGEGEKGLLHLCIWASALQLISVSPNRTLGLKWKNEKCSKHLYTLKNSANPEIHHHLAKKKDSKQLYYKSLPRRAIWEGEEIFFIEWTLTFIMYLSIRGKV